MALVPKHQKLKIVSVENGIDNLGFRKFSAYARSLCSDTEVYYVTTGNLISYFERLFPTNTSGLDDEDIHIIAKELANADIVGFSSMTPYADTTTKIMQEIRTLNPDVFIIWGGIHAIIHPEDAILHADAVCTGEGEFAFEAFMDALSTGKKYKDCKGFWFNSPFAVVKNPNLPLMNQEMMDGLPFPTYQDGEKIYEKRKGFRPISRKDFLRYSGLSYNAIWSIGCPFKCTYCANTKFIEYDEGYRKIRHSSPQTIISEIRRAIRKHSNISTIVFHDDSLMALPHKVLEEFATLFKKEINLPFAVFGLIPNYVREEKMKILIEGGMNRVRMGIQSGSERIIEFYERPTPLEKIREASRIINTFKEVIMPPHYDIIVDNPIETKEDVQATLDLLYELPRPYKLNINSLRVIPNTVLSRKIEELNLDITSIRENFMCVPATLANILTFVLQYWKMPRFLYERLREKVQPTHVQQRHFPILLHIVRFLSLLNRTRHHLKHMDFSVFPGWSGYVLWKIGIIGIWRKYWTAKREKFIPAKLKQTSLAK